jgi:hypothetical protein
MSFIPQIKRLDMMLDFEIEWESATCLEAWWYARLVGHHICWIFQNSKDECDYHSFLNLTCS